LATAAWSLVLLYLEGATCFFAVSCFPEVECQFMGLGREGYWMLVVVFKSTPDSRHIAGHTARMNATIVPPTKAAINSMETTAYVLLHKL
jgi:hypothetical protein